MGKNKLVLSGVLQKVSKTYNGRIYPEDIFKKYLEDEKKRIKQQLRIKKIKRLYEK